MLRAGADPSHSMTKMTKMTQARCSFTSLIVADECDHNDSMTKMTQGPWSFTLRFASGGFNRNVAMTKMSKHQAQPYPCRGDAGPMVTLARREIVQRSGTRVADVEWQGAHCDH
jgi:hypothetical protein